MSTSFIHRALCQGFRPNSFKDANPRSRTHLVSLLLQNRSVPRIIVASTGMGKSFLAAEYAETIFAWRSCIWLSGKSPCFLRDLDASTLAADCAAALNNYGLVVVDDVPFLDNSRASKFKEQVEQLLSKGCEVILICTPKVAQAFEFLESSVVLSSRDLLLTIEEVDVGRSPEERIGKPAEQFSPSERVPALLWGEGNDPSSSILSSIVQVEQSGVAALMLHAMAATGKGRLQDLQMEVPLYDEAIEQLSFLAKEYPHFEIDLESATFKAPKFSAKSVAASSKVVFESVFGQSYKEETAGVAKKWADYLVSIGEGERACEIMRLMESRINRANWLIDNAMNLFRLGVVFETYQIACDSKGLNAMNKARLRAVEALCLRLLGDETLAAKKIERLLSDQNAPGDARVLSAFVALRLDNEHLATTAQNLLAASLDLACVEEPIDFSDFWLPLAQVRLATAQGNAGGTESWYRLMATESTPEAQLLGASWACASLAASEELQQAAGVEKFPTKLEDFIREKLSALEVNNFDFFIVSAGFSMEEAHSRGVQYTRGPLSMANLLLLRQGELKLLAQRKAYEALIRNNNASAMIDATGSGANFQGGKSASFAFGKGLTKVPRLKIRLFGGFELYIGDKPVDLNLIKRQHTRILLAILAVNNGKDVSREVLVRTLWPEANEEAAKKSYYSVWSQLKKALSLPDGSCPYIRRNICGCSLEPSLVESDVNRFLEICRELMFGRADVDYWQRLFADLDSEFSGPFMPSENKNEHILKIREDFRSRLVDALVSATVNMVDAGHPDWGLWFSRAALRHDDTREDAYVALMQAQIANNQRTAAMMTYIRCRDILNERLGIDPSPQTSSIYDLLLEATSGTVDLLK